MANLADRPTQLDDILAIENATTVRKLLTDTNFEVLSVEAVTAAKYNTVAYVKVDRNPELPPDVVPCHRYKTKRVPFTRLTLKEALIQAGFELDALGRLKVAAVASVNDFVTAVADKLNVDPDEITFTKAGATSAGIKAKPDSLGFIGSVTITTEEGTPNEVRWIKEGDDFSLTYLASDAAGLNKTVDATMGEVNYLVVDCTAITEKIKARLIHYIASEQSSGETVTLNPGEKRIIPVSIPTGTSGSDYRAQLLNESGSYTDTVYQCVILSNV